MKLGKPQQIGLIVVVGVAIAAGMHLMVFGPHYQDMESVKEKFNEGVNTLKSSARPESENYIPDFKKQTAVYDKGVSDAITAMKLDMPVLYQKSTPAEVEQQYDALANSLKQLLALKRTLRTTKMPFLDSREGLDEVNPQQLQNAQNMMAMQQGGNTAFVDPFAGTLNRQQGWAIPDTLQSTLNGTELWKQINNMRFTMNLMKNQKDANQIVLEFGKHNGLVRTAGLFEPKEVNNWVVRPSVMASSAMARGQQAVAQNLMSMSQGTEQFGGVYFDLMKYAEDIYSASGNAGGGGMAMAGMGGAAAGGTAKVILPAPSQMLYNSQSSPQINPYSINRYGVLIPGLKKFWVSELLWQNKRAGGNEAAKFENKTLLREALDVNFDCGTPAATQQVLLSMTKSLDALGEVLKMADESGIQQFKRVNVLRPIAGHKFKRRDQMNRGELLAEPKSAATPAADPNMMGGAPGMMGGPMMGAPGAMMGGPMMGPGMMGPGMMGPGMMGMGGGMATPAPTPKGESIGSLEGLEIWFTGSPEATMQFMFKLSTSPRSYAVDDMEMKLDPATGLMNTSGTIELITNLDIK